MLDTPVILPPRLRARRWPLIRGPRRQFLLGGLYNSGATCGCCGGSACDGTVCVVDCNGTAIPGATVTIAAPGGNVSGLTDPGGCATLGVGTAGTYATTISKTGYATVTTEIDYTCAAGNTKVTLNPAGSGNCNIAVVACGGVTVAGATVAIDGQTIVSDSGGNAQFNMARAGTYPYTVTKSRYQTYNGTFTVNDPCFSSSGTASLTPASGYTCCAQYGCEPLPTTLHLTDSAYGSTTLTYNSGTGQFVGTLAISYPGGCGCPATAPTITYTLDCAGGFTVSTQSDSSHVGVCPGTTAATTCAPTLGGGPNATCPPFEYDGTTPGCGCSGGLCTSDSTAVYLTAATITITE